MNNFEKSQKKYYTKKQLDMVRSAKVGIAGAGGLGSNVAVILARCGFRYFEIMDHDNISASNLNRQQFLFNEIGKNKVETLKSFLLKINPSMNIKIHKVKWNNKIAADYFKNCDVLFECFDKPKNKRDFTEYYQKKVKFLISANGLSNPFNGKIIKAKKIENIYIIGDNNTDITKTKMPLTTNVLLCAGLMSDLALRLIIKP